MKISEIITFLEKAKKEVGDTDLQISGCYYGFVYWQARPNIAIDYDFSGGACLIGCNERGEISPKTE